MKVPVLIREDEKIHHKTSPIKDQDIPILARVIAIIEKYIITRTEWKFITEKGSLTLQHRANTNLVIKVFMDITGT